MDVIARRFIVRVELFLGIPVSVDRRIALPFFREVFEGEDGGDGTDRDAGATIDAFGRIKIELFFVFKLRLVPAGVNAIDRADIHTCGVLGADAGFGNHVSPTTSPFIRRRPGTSCATSEIFLYHGPSGATSGIE